MRFHDLPFTSSDGIPSTAHSLLRVFSNQEESISHHWRLVHSALTVSNLYISILPKPSTLKKSSFHGHSGGHESKRKSGSKEDGSQGWNLTKAKNTFPPCTYCRKANHLFEKCLKDISEF